MSGNLASREWWDGLAVRVSSDRMLIGPEAAGLIASAFERMSGTDQVGLSDRANHVRRVAIAVAAQAGAGHGDVPDRVQPPESVTWITTTQARELLGLSARQVRRLAVAGELGETRTVRGRLLLDRAEVAALAAERDERRAHKL